MAGILTSNGYLGFLKQVSKGTAIVPTVFARLNAAESTEIVQEVAEFNTLNSNQLTDFILKTGTAPQGTFSCFARPVIAGYLLAYVLGADAVTGASSPYQHVLTRADAIPYITVERKLISAERIKDCKINQLVISGEAGQPVILTASYLGKDAAIESAATPTYETNVPYMFFNGAYTFGGGATSLISSFVITISRNLIASKTTEITQYELDETKFNVECALRLKVEADTMYLANLYGASTATVPALDDDALTIDLTYGATAGLKELKFEIPALKIISSKKALDPNPNVLYLDVIARAVKSASEIITVTCKNELADDMV
jgi:hypothetical protein